MLTISLLVGLRCTMLWWLGASLVALVPVEGLYNTDVVVDVQLNEEMNSFGDVYYPLDVGHIVPCVIVLPEEGVYKKSYSDVAVQIASRGFIVVVSHYEYVSAEGEDRVRPAMGLVPESLVYLSDHNLKPESPLYDLVDLHRVGILGHGLGGLMGTLVAAANGSVICVEEGYCEAERFFPDVPELVCVVSYGSDLYSRRSGSGALIPVDIEGISINLFHGVLDGVSGVKSGLDSYGVIAGPRSRWVCDGLNHHSITNDPKTEDPLFEGTELVKTNEEAIKTLGKNISFLFSAWLKNDNSVKEKYYVNKVLPSGTPEWLHLVDAYIDETNFT